MKRYLIILLNLLIAISVAYAQDGTWSGNLDVQGNKLPLVFHLDEDKPSMDSPAQGAKGIPIQFSKEEDGQVAINIPLAGASFHGKLANDTISGIFKQHGFEFPLILTQGERKQNRPQTPVGPGPYREEEVSFSNGDATLKGTLTLPEGYTKDTPVLIMVTGSGLQNRDEELFEHKPFAVIADALARKGIATLRYDDRGYGESTGDAVNCTTKDLMYDALSGINLLRQRFNRVGVLGHSEGGTIAMMLAADKQADFIVSLAGMAISGKELLLKQNRHTLFAAVIPEKTVEDYCRILSSVFDNEEDFKSQLEATDLPPALKQNLSAVIAQMESPYMRYFISLDLRPRLGEITCPVLALNGTKDTQVFYEENLAALEQGLPANKYNLLEAVDGLNHLFQHCQTGSVLEYGQIEETISPQILETISSWIKTVYPDK